MNLITLGLGGAAPYNKATFDVSPKVTKFTIKESVDKVLFKPTVNKVVFNITKVVSE